MKLGTRRIVQGFIGAAAVVWMAGVASVSTQAQTEAKQPMAEDVFKNIQVMRGMPVNEFMTAMGFFSAATSLNCTDCHTTSSLGGWALFGEDTPLKRTTRRMITMMNDINKANFGGRRMVTCYTCHRGTQAPEVTPSLLVQYGAPLDDPNELQVRQQESGAPTPDQVFDKYLQAIGGAQRAAGLKSFVAKGTYEGFDTAFSKIPTDIYAEAPGKRSRVIHMSIGENTTTYDGRTAWIAAPDRPLPLFTLLPGNELEGAKLEAELAFPAQIKQALTAWRVGPSAMIDDREVVVVQGATPSRSPVRLYFDKESGLLVRALRYEDTRMGLAPTEVDYSDYRDVAGVKMPFQIMETWVDGRSTVKLTEIQPNVQIAAAKFAAPAPAKPASR